MNCRTLSSFVVPMRTPVFQFGMPLRARLRVDRVQHVVARDEQSADPAELLELLEELAVLVEDLNPMVAAIGHEQASARVERERMRRA